MSEYDKICDYCRQPVSVFESLTEFGRHWHDRCYIYKTNKEVDAYKKKFINGTLSKGDKADLVDKYNLVQTLKADTVEFKGWVQVNEKIVNRRELTDEPDKMMLYQDKDGLKPVLDEWGKPIFVEDNTPSITLRNAVMRPNVIRRASKSKMIKSADEILQIEGSV